MAFDESLNTTHISTNLRNYEAARSGFFTLVVDNLTNLLKPNFKGDAREATDADRIQNAQTVVKLNVVAATVPQFSVGTEEFRRGNDTVKFATVPTWEGGSLTVDDIVGLDTKSLLISWLYLAYNPHTRKGGRMADYKKTATLCEYTQDYELIRTWTLEGVFITKVSDDEFNREQDGKRQLKVEFSYDRAIMDLPEVERVEEQNQ